MTPTGHAVRQARELPRRTSSGLATGPVPWLGALLVLYLLLPLVGLVTQISSGRAAGFGAPGLGDALWVSMVAATCTTAICALGGVPLAYGLARSEGRTASVVGALVLLPLALPPLVAGILLVSVIGPNTALGGFFGGRLTDSMAGIVLAQTFVAAPFTIVAARSAFAALDPSLLEVAATCGLGSWRRFTTVALPSAAPGIGAGLLLSWLRAFGEFGATVVVAYHPTSLPVFTYIRFGGWGLIQAMAPTVLALATALVVLVASRIRLPRHDTVAAVRAVTPTAPTGRQTTGQLSFELGCRLGSFHLHVAHHAVSRHLAVLGPSGAGKTTLLRCLAGLAGPHVGSVHLGSSTLDDLPTEQRRLGYVPQEPSLIPRRSLWGQVTLGSDADAGLAAYWLDRLGLIDLVHHREDELSGGQRHRVAVARALARSPQLVLLDEPFSSLDVPVRRRLQRELRGLLRDGGFASVLVTHDPEEAAVLADEVLVIDGGRLLQAGPVAEVFEHPSTPMVAQLLGIANLNKGRVLGWEFIEMGGTMLRAPGLRPTPSGTPVLWSIRPEHVAVSFDTSRRYPFDAVVRDVTDLGTGVELSLTVVGDIELLARLPSQPMLPPGTRCTLDIPVSHLHVWPKEAAGTLAWADAQA